MFDNIIRIVHKRKPLIHSITNYVSMNDCANILLACGGAAIMAEDALEVRQITAICDGLNLNIGMLNENKLEANKKNSLTGLSREDEIGAREKQFIIGMKNNKRDKSDCHKRKHIRDKGTCRRHG